MSQSSSFYSRSQFKPIADEVIALCVENVKNTGIFNADNLVTRLRVEQIHGGFLFLWDGGSIPINLPACDYLRRRARRFSVFVISA